LFYPERLLLNPLKNTMQQFQSEFLQQLQERGFISQITHSKELDELMEKQKITAYIGFDCTAQSLHIGSLIQIMILQLFC
jgi:tyrosyl-tRNA synthetase